MSIKGCFGPQVSWIWILIYTHPKIIATFQWRDVKVKYTSNAHVAHVATTTTTNRPVVQSTWLDVGVLKNLSLFSTYSWSGIFSTTTKCEGLLDTYLVLLYKHCHGEAKHWKVNVRDGLKNGCHENPTLLWNMTSLWQCVVNNTDDSMSKNFVHVELGFYHARHSSSSFSPPPQC